MPSIEPREGLLFWPAVSMPANGESRDVSIAVVHPLPLCDVAIVLRWFQRHAQVATTFKATARSVAWVSLYTEDGHACTIKTHVLGAAPAKLPIPKPRCPHLQQLIRQLEGLPAPDGFRRITHLLVDAGARDFNWVDPLPAELSRTPPAIAFAVITAKFQGQVVILYDPAADLYAVELRRDEQLIDRADSLHFDSLAAALERLIDDGSWRQIHVAILSSGKSARH